MFIQRSDFSNFDQDHDSPKNRGFLTEKTQNKYDLNKFCVECQKPNPEWVSVNNGVYLCIQCAGIHRGFGVQVSFVRSLEMDKIDELHVKMLKEGGNRKFLEFVKLYELEKFSQHDKYITKACEFYRTCLQNSVQSGKKFKLGPNMFFKMPLNLGQQFIYSGSYIQQRNSHKLQQPKKPRSNSIIEEISLFGQYVKEKITLGSQISIGKCAPSCKNKIRESQVDLSQ